VTGQVPLGGFTSWKQGTLVIFDAAIMSWIPLGGGIAPPLDVVLGQGRTTAFNIFFHAAQGGGSNLLVPSGGPVTYRLPNVDGIVDHGDVLTAEPVSPTVTNIRFREVDTICEVYLIPRDQVKIFPLAAVNIVGSTWTNLVGPYQIGNPLLMGFEDETYMKNRFQFSDIDLILERCPILTGQSIAFGDKITQMRQFGNPGFAEIKRVMHFTAHFKLTVPRMFVNTIGSINDIKWHQLVNGFMIGFEVDTSDRPKFSFTERITFPYNTNTFGFVPSKPYIERASALGVTGHCTSGTYNNLGEDADDILRSQGNGDGIICGQYPSQRIWCAIPQFVGSGTPASYIGGDYQCYLSGLFVVLTR